MSILPKALTVNRRRCTAVVSVTSTASLWSAWSWPAHQLVAIPQADAGPLGRQTCPDSAAPMPDTPPVTTATRPAICVRPCMISFGCQRRRCRQCASRGAQEQARILRRGGTENCDPLHRRDRPGQHQHALIIVFDRSGETITSRRWSTASSIRNRAGWTTIRRDHGVDPQSVMAEARGMTLTSATSPPSASPISGRPRAAVGARHRHAPAYAHWSGRIRRVRSAGGGVCARTGWLEAQTGLPLARLARSADSAAVG